MWINYVEKLWITFEVARTVYPVTFSTFENFKSFTHTPNFLKYSFSLLTCTFMILFLLINIFYHFHSIISPFQSLFFHLPIMHIILPYNSPVFYFYEKVGGYVLDSLIFYFRFLPLSPPSTRHQIFPPVTHISLISPLSHLSSHLSPLSLHSSTLHLS